MLILASKSLRYDKYDQINNCRKISHYKTKETVNQKET